jgi:hypothetical protein
VSTTINALVRGNIGPGTFTSPALAVPQDGSNRVFVRLNITAGVLNDPAFFYTMQAFRSYDGGTTFEPDPFLSLSDNGGPPGRFGNPSVGGSLLNTDNQIASHVKGVLAINKKLQIGIDVVFDIDGRDGLVRAT